MRPGDSVPIEQLVVVPRTYRVLLVDLETIYDRFPVRQRIAVRLKNKAGAVSLKSTGDSIDLQAYFGV
jgi:hypothetical protein